MNDRTDDAQKIRPGTVGPEKERQVKKQGIVLGLAGYSLALGAAFYFRLVDVTGVSWGTLGTVTAVTALMQSVLWLIPHLGWDRHLHWDDDYVLLPLAVAAVLLLSYAAAVPEARHLFLVGWFAALMFGLRFLGFREVLGLGVLVTALYAAALSLHLDDATSFGINLRVEGGHAVALLAVHVFAASVFERVRREHDEKLELQGRLADETVTDPLTGLRNRRYLERFLETETARANRYDASFSVAMLDLDHFKIYNDTHGHPAGDQVLTSVADILRSVVRDADVIVRYGGEEFTVVMPGGETEAARAVCERIRASVEERTFQGEDVMPGGLTVSLGVASFPTHADSGEELIEAADQALYDAKERGRNQVVVADPVATVRPRHDLAGNVLHDRSDGVPPP